MIMFSLVVGFTSAASAATQNYNIALSESVFAVVTHKAGVGSALAHDHFIYPSQYKSDISVDPAHPEQARFRMQFPVTALVVDDPQAKTRWFPEIKAAGILDHPFPEVSEKDRAKIREHMLDEGQLDAQRFPEISAELKSITEKKSDTGGKGLGYEVSVALTAHGKTVERPFLVNIEQTGDTARVKGFGSFKFTDFGIKPFSAFLGAVRNQDLFHVFVDMKAKGGK